MSSDTPRPAASPPAVSVIIPNWNGLAHLPECLSSLEEQSWTDFEVLLVDNGSTDGSLALVQRDYPWVKCLPLQDNGGFSVAVNHGIEASSSELIVLLNNDTRASAQWLERLIMAMRSCPEAAFAASRMLRHEPPHDIDAVGDGFSLVYGGINIGAGEPADSYLQPAWIFGACAGAAIYRRSLFEDIGLFDEDFFLIYEDVDIDLRAQVAGHRCLYVPEAVIYHKRGASTNLADAKTTARAWRNMIWVAGKSLPLPLLVVWMALFAVNLGWRTLRFGWHRLWMKLGPAKTITASGSASGTTPRTEADATPGHRASRARAYMGATWEGLSTIPRKRRAQRRRPRRVGSLALLRIIRRPFQPLSEDECTALSPSAVPE